MFSDGFHAQICETHTCCGPWEWSYHPDDEWASYSSARWAQNPYSFNVTIFELIIIKIDHRPKSNSDFTVQCNIAEVIIITFMLSCQISGRLLSRLIFQCILYIYISVSTGLELGLTYFSCQSGMSICYCGWNPKNHQLCVDEFLLGDSGWCPFPCSIAGYLFWFFTPRMCVETVGVDRDSSWRR